MELKIYVAIQKECLEFDILKMYKYLLICTYFSRFLFYLLLYTSDDWNLVYLRFLIKIKYKHVFDM